MARPKSPTDTSANLGFEATARRGSANPKGGAIPRSLEGNLWLAAASRGEAMTDQRVVETRKPTSSRSWEPSRKKPTKAASGSK